MGNDDDEDDDEDDNEDDDEDDNDDQQKQTKPHTHTQTNYIPPRFIRTNRDDSSRHICVCLYLPSQTPFQPRRLFLRKDQRIKGWAQLDHAIPPLFSWGTFQSGG